MVSNISFRKCVYHINILDDNNFNYYYSHNYIADNNNQTRYRYFFYSMNTS